MAACASNLRCMAYRKSARSGIIQTCRSSPSSVVIYTLELFVPLYNTTTGRRSFPVAAATAWNTLPVMSIITIYTATFTSWRRSCSFPDIIINNCYDVNFEMVIAIHVKYLW